MRQCYHSLYQRSSVEDHHRVEEQAWQEEVETGSEQPRELQRRNVGERDKANEINEPKKKNLKIKVLDASSDHMF